MDHQMIPFAIFFFMNLVYGVYLGITRVIGKEKISTIVTLVCYVVISTVAIVIYIWVLELGINSFYFAFISSHA